MRSVFGSRGSSLHRHGYRGIRLQVVDYGESATWFFAAATLRTVVEESRRRAFSPDAGERNLHSRRWTCSAKNDRARGRPARKKRGSRLMSFIASPKT